MKKTVLVLVTLSTIFVGCSKKDESFECGEIITKANGYFVIENYDTGELRQVKPSLENYLGWEVGNRYCVR